MTRLTTASYVKIGLLVLLAIVLCGGIASCSARCTPSYDFDYSYDDVTMRETGAGTVAGADVRSISIAWAAGSATITVCDDAETGGEVVFTETGSAVRSHPLRWTCENGTLYISYDTLKNGISGCSSFGSKQLEVKVPRSVAQSLERFELDVASGDYTVEGLTCQTAKLGVASGTVEVADVVVQNLKADIASGHVALAGDLAEAFDLKIASGDVSISTRQCPKTGKLDIASGSVNIALPSQSAFGLSYDALSGRVELRPLRRYLEGRVSQLLQGHRDTNDIRLGDPPCRSHGLRPGGFVFHHDGGGPAPRTVRGAVRLVQFGLLDAPGRPDPLRHGIGRPLRHHLVHDDLRVVVVGLRWHQGTAHWHHRTFGCPGGAQGACS